MMGNFNNAAMTFQVSQSTFPLGRDRVATVSLLKERHHSHGSPDDKKKVGRAGSINLGT